ncbi:MAG TPA: barstar family protein [Marmoricola sp.]|nr:barstar family protein [Marmoricola sp.]
MTGLAGVIAGHLKPGVYQWHTAFSPTQVRHSVEHAGWRFGYVDGWTHQDKGTFLDAVADALQFPEYFGQNFDALTDCLRDVDGNGVVLLWDGWGPLARDDRRAFDIAVDCFAGRARDDAQGPFVTLLRGEGPDIDVPVLDA